MDIPEEYEGRPVRVRIVGDAAITSERIADGKLVPLIIVDTSSRPDLEELIRVHRHLGAGDVEVQWGRDTKSSSTVTLQLSFTRPIKTLALIDFDVAKQGILVSQILATKILLLQAGREGDRVRTTLDAPRIFIEIPATGFGPYWGEIVRKTITKRMRDSGLTREQARKAASEVIEWQQEWGRARTKDFGPAVEKSQH